MHSHKNENQIMEQVVAKICHALLINYIKSIKTYFVTLRGKSCAHRCKYEIAVERM